MDLPPDDDEDYFDPSLVMNWEEDEGGSGSGNSGSGGMDGRSQFSFTSSQDSLRQLQQVLDGDDGSPPPSSSGYDYGTQHDCQCRYYYYC